MSRSEGGPKHCDEPDGGGGIVEAPAVLVPPGEYVLQYLYYATAEYFGNAKVLVHFSIIEDDVYAGHIVTRYYNASRLLESPRKNGQFAARHGADINRELGRCGIDSERVDRIRIGALKGKRLKAQISTVTNDRSRDELPGCCRYSKVKKLIQALPDAD